MIIAMQEVADEGQIQQVIDQNKAADSTNPADKNAQPKLQ